MKLAHIAYWCVAALGAIFLGGCGGDVDQDLPEIAQVTGTVKLDGVALADAQVTFIPEKGPTATGKTDADGKFVLGTKSSDDGAVIGKHKISVTKQAATASEITSADAYAVPDPNKPAAGGIPPKYADANSSGLTATIEAGKENVVPVELSSK